MLGATPSAISAWLAAGPDLRDRPDELVALVAGVIAFLFPYGVRSVWSSEPRTYSLGPRGRDRLAECVASGRVASLSLESDPSRATPTRATAFVNLGAGPRPGSPITLGLQLDRSAAGGLMQAAPEVTDFVRRWFGRLEAAAAFVSDRPGDHFLVTAYEQQPGRGAVTSWASARRHARGVFWAMGLGPELCGALGGRDRALREAPVPIVAAVGEGVWLQASVVPPADLGVLERLAAYLAPVLTWTAADLLATEEEDRRAAARTRAMAPQQQAGTAPPGGAPPPPAGAPPPAASRARPRRAVPMRVLGDLEVDAGLNLYLAAPTTSEQRRAVERAVAAWYAEGFGGAFGGAGFHDIGGPSVDEPGAVMRWHVDFGSTDPPRALLALRERLGGLADVKVVRLVVGTEHAQ